MQGNDDEAMLENDTDSLVSGSALRDENQLVDYTKG